MSEERGNEELSVAAARALAGSGASRSIEAAGRPLAPERARHGAGVALSVVLVAGCNAPAPPGGTGGTSVEPGTCGRGLVVVQSDYQSTNVSLVAVDGEVLSSSFISSASSSTGLSAPLSGDVVPPTWPVAGEDIVLIDRYPAAVLTFVDVESAQVRAQLSVGTGFASNPQDYLAWSEHVALLTRLDPNPTPGQEPFDGGSDLLVLDPTTPAIVDRIDLRASLADLPGSLHVHPGRMVPVGARAVVLASPSSTDFLESSESRLLVVDPEARAIESVLTLSGLHGCNGLARSPSSDQIAVACSGRFEGGSTPTLSEAGIALVDVTAGAPTGGGGPVPILSVARVYPAAELVGQPLGFAVDFVAEDRLVAVAFGRFSDGLQPAEPDRLFELGLATGTVRSLLQSSEEPFTLGEVRCLGACGVCFATDAERAVLHSLAIGSDGLEPGASTVVDSAIGLPPRLLGRF